MSPVLLFAPALAASLGPWLWTGLGTVFVVVAIVVAVRSRPPTPPGGGPRPPASEAPESPTAALAPSTPVTVVVEPPGSQAEEGPVLPRIPVESKEWMEGEELEFEGAAPSRPLPPVEALLDVLRAGEPNACHRAVEDLVRHGADALPALEAAIRDGDPDLRVDAARALALIRAETD